MNRDELKIMPIVSKYNNEQFDALMNDLITALEKHKAPVDLSLMVLGNLTTNIINGMAPAQRQAILALRADPEVAALMAAGLAEFGGPVRILLATADRTAQMFEAAWDRDDPRIHRCHGAGHAYVEPAHRAWLEAQLLEMLRA